MPRSLGSGASAALLTIPTIIGILLILVFQWPPLVSACVLALRAIVPFSIRLHLLMRDAEKRSAQQLAFIRNFIDVIPQPVYVKDQDSRYVVVNHAFLTELDLPLEAVIGHTAHDFLPNTKKDVEESIREDKEVLQGLRVTAEGIEDRASLEILQNLGCDTGQGYFISRPIPAEDFEAFFTTSRWSPHFGGHGLTGVVAVTGG